ncbi:MAG: hypothetical protein P8K77_05725 [Polaribacter sp.]|nr:hypothetical protein [Polaribacter sp.]
MQIHGIIYQFPKEIKLLIIAFTCTLSIGFYSGISFVKETSGTEPKGIEQRYLGNENDVAATKMQFKKTKAEVMTLVHNHVLSLSVIFFLLAVILATTSINKKLKVFLMIEPFVSVLLTFGGIYLMWSGVLWFKYVVLISGILMTSTFMLSTFFILKACLIKR